MKAILKSVSRSFYLTIQFLPGVLREPISVAYLLARATDTLADTDTVPATFRLTTLRQFAAVVAGRENFEMVAGALRDFAAQQDDPAERRLVENLPACVDWLNRMDAADREDIRTVLKTIVRGQTLDLERFSDATRVTSLQSASELDEYTYLVAGCVGEFWTRLGLRRLPLFAARLPNEMVELGIAYGKGLQLINVLRDRPADLAHGRGYLPADELAAAPLEEVFARWLGVAEEKLEAGVDYCAALTNWRVRLATALPALIGARTIALLREAGPSNEKIKVPRAEVRRILVAGVLATRSPAALRALFDRCGRRPPRGVDTRSA